MKIIDALDMTDRQGRKYQALHVLVEDKETVLPLVPNDQLKVLREDGSQAAVIRFCGVGHIRYLRKPQNPPLILSVACQENVQGFLGMKVIKL